MLLKLETAEQFWALQHEVERIEMRIAQGQESDADDERLKELDEELQNCGWTIDMDTGAAIRVAHDPYYEGA